MMRNLALCSAIILVLFSSPAHAIKVGPFLPTPHEQDGTMGIQGEYKSGFLVIKVTNPSYPEVLHNEYIYIPKDFRNGRTVTLWNGSTVFFANGTNIEVTLGDGFEQTGQATMYPDWVGDKFEKGVEEARKLMKVFEYAVIIGSKNPAQAAMMVQEADRRPELDMILKSYKQTRDASRGMAMEYFTEILSTLYKPEWQLPIDKSQPYWILPPSSALVIKIPARQRPGNPSFSVMLKEYRILNTGKQEIRNEHDELLRLQSVAKLMNLGQSPGFDFPEIKFKSAQTVDATTPSVVIDEINGNMPKSIGRQIWDLFHAVLGSITIYLKFGGSDLDMRIIDPDGNVYYGSQAGENAEAVTINNAIPGDWKIEVINRDVPPEGEPYTLTILENEAELDALDFDIVKKFQNIKKRGRSPEYFGTMEVRVKPTGKDIAYLEITDPLNNSKAFAPTVLASNGSKEFSLPREAYSLSADTKKISASIDITKGILTEQMGKVQKAYKLEGDWHILLRYYAYMNFKGGQITTETKVKGISTDGSSLTKGELTKFVP